MTAQPAIPGSAHPGSKRRRRWLIGASVFAIVAVVAGSQAARLAADPRGPKDCGTVLGKLEVPPAPAASAVTTEPNWAQRGGTINDASCLSRTEVTGIIAVKSEDDVRNALTYARINGLKVSAAGVKHSMGGQAFAPGNVVLDMRGFNAVQLDEAAGTITVGAGATWHQIQNQIHPRFAVKAMQSSDIFSVGGSIAVNAHGMDHQAGAVMGSLRSMRVMKADGSVVEVSRTNDPDLFRHIVGGYGLFGIVLTATLDVVPNAVYRSERQLITTGAFPEVFAKLESDPAIGLTYTHLSTASGNLMDQALVYSYRQVPEDQGLMRAPLEEVASTKLRRLTINLSKRSNVFKAVKWWSEKNLEHRLEDCTVSRAQAMGSGEACLVSRNDPMHDSVAYLYNDLPDETDILHEYFVPRDQIVPFITAMRTLFKDQDANLLNASIRAVDAEDNVLSYAPQKAFSVVLYLNQKTDAAGNARMEKLTRSLIDLTHTYGGKFFLPYQPYYDAAQLKQSYPMIGDFFAAKRRYDPDEMFVNSWYLRYAPAFASDTQPAATLPSSTSGAPAA